MSPHATPRYSTLSISLHWLMLLLLAATFACIELRTQFPKGSDPREALKTWHYMLGLSVFALVWLRLLARWLRPAPAISPPPRVWEARAATAAHLALYALMIFQPLGGWLILSAEGKTIPFFGLELPALMGENKALAEELEELHEISGEAAYWLIGLHAAAALFHHYIRRDDTLARILPPLKPRGR